MRILFISILIVANIFAAVISGNQGKVSIINGSANVSAGGKSVTLNSGQISFINASGASAARSIKRGDLTDVYSSLRAENGDESDDDQEKVFVNLKYPPNSYSYAKKIKTNLISKKVSRISIKLTKEQGKTVLIVKRLNLKLLKTIYPAYYDAAKKYFSKKSNFGKVPTLKMNHTYVRKIHG